MAGGKLVPTAAKFGVSKSTLGLHRSRCLAPRLVAATKIVTQGPLAKQETARAKAIAAGKAEPTLAERISLTGLLEKIDRSLQRLETAAGIALADNVPTALAAVSGQLHRGVETAARLQGLGPTPQEPAEGSKFNIVINIPTPSGNTYNPLRTVSAGAGESSLSTERMNKVGVLPRSSGQPVRPSIPVDITPSHPVTLEAEPPSAPQQHVQFTPPAFDVLLRAQMHENEDLSEDDDE